MNKFVKSLIISVAILATIIFIIYIFPIIKLEVLGNEYNNSFNKNIGRHSEAITKFCSWLNISDIPSSATNISVRSEGNMMNRNYYIQFNSSKNDIKKWIADSPGLKHPLKKEKISSEKVEYTIIPKEEAQICHVTIDYEQSKVDIFISMN